jgi:hypothetical protein
VPGTREFRGHELSTASFDDSVGETGMKLALHFGFQFCCLLYLLTGMPENLDLVVILTVNTSLT